MPRSATCGAANALSRRRPPRRRTQADRRHRARTARLLVERTLRPGGVPRSRPQSRRQPPRRRSQQSLPRSVVATRRAGHAASSQSYLLQRSDQLRRLQTVRRRRVSKPARNCCSTPRSKTSKASTPIVAYHTALKASYQILDERGARVDEKEFALTEEYCQNPRRDFFIRYFHLDAATDLRRQVHAATLASKTRSARKSAKRRSSSRSKASRHSLVGASSRRKSGMAQLLPAQLRPK